MFGVFSWLPILQAVVMSVQQTNLVTEPVFVGLDNFVKVWHDPLFWTAVKNTVWFALLALVFGYPVPLVLAVLMSTVRRRRGLYSGLAYLPVVVPPVVAVLLWKVFFDGSRTGVFNTSWACSACRRSRGSRAPPPPCHRWSWRRRGPNAGATVIIYLAALVAVPAGAV